MRDQVQNHWLAGPFYREFVAERKSQAYAQDGVPVMQGRGRRKQDQDEPVGGRTCALCIEGGRLPLKSAHRRRNALIKPGR
jgi:hypothetical protein